MSRHNPETALNDNDPRPTPRDLFLSIRDPAAAYAEVCRLYPMMTEAQIDNAMQEAVEELQRRAADHFAEADALDAVKASRTSP